MHSYPSLEERSGGHLFLKQGPILRDSERSARPTWKGDGKSN